MADQMKDQADAVAEGDANEAMEAEASSDRYSSGIKKLDGVVYKVDAGVRKISQEIHSPPPAEDPERPRVGTGIKPLDNVVYKIDHGVRRISEGLHKAVDSKKKQ